TVLYEGTYVSDGLQTALLERALKEAGISGDQSLPAGLHVVNGIDKLGKRIHYYFNYTGSATTFVYDAAAGTDLLTGQHIASPEKLTLKPWDLAIIQEP